MDIKHFLILIKAKINIILKLIQDISKKKGKNIKILIIRMIIIVSQMKMKSMDNMHLKNNIKVKTRKKMDNYQLNIRIIINIILIVLIIKMEDMAPFINIILKIAILVLVKKRIIFCRNCINLIIMEQMALIIKINQAKINTNIIKIINIFFVFFINKYYIYRIVY